MLFGGMQEGYLAVTPASATSARGHRPRLLAIDGKEDRYSGSSDTQLCQHVVAHLQAHVPAGTVLDGELVSWDLDAGRTTFPALQRRVNAGRALRPRPPPTRCTWLPSTCSPTRTATCSSSH
ncbi:hypothetical protein [Actinoplanes sp. URMC 104]|uniref:hypothetical protein n=1 Tax=Actinoplanes sp. URMC 104 TaxID=3423409 RepID=UPI003F1B60CD